MHHTYIVSTILVMAIITGCGNEQNRNTVNQANVDVNKLNNNASNNPEVFGIKKLGNVVLVSAGSLSEKERNEYDTNLGKYIYKDEGGKYLVTANIIELGKMQQNIAPINALHVKSEMYEYDVMGIVTSSPSIIIEVIKTIYEK